MHDTLKANREKEPSHRLRRAACWLGTAATAAVCLYWARHTAGIYQTPAWLTTGGIALVASVDYILQGSPTQAEINQVSIGAGLNADVTAESLDGPRRETLIDVLNSI